MMSFSSTASRNLRWSASSRRYTGCSPPLIRVAASTLASSNAAPLPLPATNVNRHARDVPSRALSMAMPRRGFPQYTIFGPDAALVVRAAPPRFKRAGADGVSVEWRGKLVMELVARNNTGAGFAWGNKEVFNLPVEDVGLCLAQLPNKPVELSQPWYSGTSGGAAAGGEPEAGPAPGVTQLAGDAVEKVMTIDPGEGGALTFKLDYVKEGVGGQTPPGMEGFPNTPLEVTIQAGEFEIIKSVFQSSIPYLLGWNTTLDIASAFAISRGVSGG